MKILLVGFSKIKYMPYINFYLENISNNVNDVHVLYWNRDLKDEQLEHLKSIHLHEFKQYQQDNVNRLLKIKNFIKYKRYATEVIKREKFDFVIVLHSIPGILLYKIILKKYAGKFIFDYRDITYEKNVFYKHCICSLVENSYATYVSSEGFKEILPQTSKIHISHNFLKDSLKYKIEEKEGVVVTDKIRIAFWGFIREKQLNCQIIRNVAADDRFELHYYGREQKIAHELKGYVKSIDAKNIFFHGEYVPKERYQFARQTDIIHNIYSSYNTKRAMGNKYYDGVIFAIPQLCMEQSVMGKRVTQSKIGLECNPENSNFTELIYQYYRQLDRKQFRKACNRELDNILSDYKREEKFMKNLFGEKK